MSIQCTKRTVDRKKTKGLSLTTLVFFVFFWQTSERIIRTCIVLVFKYFKNYSSERQTCFVWNTLLFLQIKVPFISGLREDDSTANTKLINQKLFDEYNQTRDTPSLTAADAMFECMYYFSHVVSVYVSNASHALPRQLFSTIKTPNRF